MGERISDDPPLFWKRSNGLGLRSHFWGGFMFPSVVALVLCSWVQALLLFWAWGLGFRV